MTTKRVKLYDLAGNELLLELPIMTGADGTSPGSSGTVPAPAATDNTKFLKGDGTWEEVLTSADQIFDPTSQNAQSGIAIAGANFLQNNTTEEYAISIGDMDSAYTGHGSVNIGIGTYALGQESVAIGHNTITDYQEAVAIGHNAEAGDNYAIAIGSGANTWSDAPGAIQIGYGSNITAKSLNIGFYDDDTPVNYQLLDGTTGLIPDARLSSNIARTSSIPTDTSDLTNGAGYITGITSSDVTTALGYTPYNSTNPAGYQANVIETIKVNNVAQTITSKAVNISVPTQASDIGAVPTSRTVNGKALTTDISLDSSDIGALPNTTTINDLTTTTQQEALDSGANATNIGQIATNTSNITTNTNNIATINSKIPAQATSTNQLADKEFVNSSIASNTANFIGTFENVQSLENYSGTVTNNDYAFVINSVVTDNGNDWATFSALDAYDKTLLTNFDYAWVINGSNFDLYRFDIVAQEWELRTSDTPKEDITLNSAYNRYKASVSGSVVTWDYEYTLNNSSFTAEEWAAITSGITAGDVALIRTALQPNDNISKLNNDAGYITGIDSTDVTTALGFTPYNSSNPSGYQANVIEAIQVNSTTQTVTNKTVNIAVPTNTSDLTNDSGFLTSSDLTDYVTTNTDQNITGTKTFVGQKKIAFKQSGTSDKLGFTLYNNSGTEKGYLEYNPSNTVDSIPLMTLGNYASASGGLTHVGFRKYSSISGASGAYNLLAPLISDAKTPFNLTTTYTNFYLPLGFKNSSTTVTTAKTGVADLSSLFTGYALASSIPTKVSDLTNDSGFITGITSSDVTTALGYTPYNSSNPSGYQANVIESIKVNGTAQTITSKAVDISVPTDTSDLTNGAGYITGITSSDVTTALGYTPQTQLVSGTNIKTINSNSLLGSGDITTPDTKNTAGSTDTSSKIFLVGATSQAANPQTYSHDTVFVDTSGRLNSAAPATSANDTTVATTKWVKDQGYTTNTGTVTSVNNVQPVNGNVTISIPTKISDLTDDTSTTPIDKADTLTGLTATVSELNIMDGVTVTASDINSVTSKIGLSSLSIDSGSTNYLGYNSSNGKFSAKVDTTVGTTSTNLVTSGAVNTALGNKLDKKPDGTNNIVDTNNKINTTYLPDFILGQLIYAGTFVPSTAVATLTTNAKTKLGTTSNTITLTNNTTAITGYAANEGCYYICSADGTFASISFVTGDWLVSTGSAWKKIDNTDAVTGVKGGAETNYRTGNVNITADNVLPAQSSNSGKFLTTNGTTASWGTPTDTKNTAGSTDTSSKIFLVGATSQAANPQTYSHDTVFVDTNGRLNSAAPASGANDTTVATTKWVKDQGYTTNVGTVTKVNNTSPDSSGNVSLTIPTTTSSVTSGSDAALTSGGAYTNLVTAVAAHSTDANKINVTKAGSTTTITINDVASATKATQDASGNTITTTYATKTEMGNVNKDTMRSTEFIVGTQTGTTGSWTGVTQDSTLYDGKNINYFLPYAGSGNASLNLTLSGGTTTNAKPVYLNGTSYVTTHFPANSVINLTYNSTKDAWFVSSYRDTNDNTYDRVKNSNNVYAVAACTNGKLIVGTSSGYKDIAASVTFDIDYPVLYCGTAAAATKTTNNTYLTFPGVNLQTTKASWTGTQWSTVYLVGTLSGKTFTIDSNVFTTTVPNTQDNKVYMPIGFLYSTYQTYFTSSRTLYAYIDGSFQQISTKYVQGSGTQPIYFDSNGQPQNTTYTLSKSVPSDAVFTDTKNTAGSTDTSSKIFLVGATSQAANPQTYSHDTVFVDTSGQLNSANPAASTNSTVVATTKWVTDKGYLTSHQTIKVNGVTGATTNNYGACSTAAGTAQKDVTLTAGTFNLETGARVVVKFANTNTAANPTLKVGSTTAKAIQYRGSAITAGYLAANRTYEFVYDGTNYQLIGDINTDTDTKTAQNISTTDNTYPMLLGYTANATANIGNQPALFGSGIKANPNTSQIVANSYAFGTNATMQYNSNTEAIEFVFS